MINYQSSGKRTAANLAAGKLKIDVLDPSLANGCVTPTLPGINWIPIKPATNSAFCAALIQKMIADKTFDAEAMSFTNQKAALVPRHRRREPSQLQEAHASRRRGHQRPREAGQGR